MIVFILSKTKSEPIIEFNEISKSYRDVKALRGVSFSIKEGDIFGYIGPNGAGKTTTLKILVGLISNYIGEVKIKGKSIKEHPNFSSLIGYLPQDVGFQEWRTVDHALRTFGLLSGMARKELDLRIPEVLQIVELNDVLRRKIKHLSGGMKQKLLLAQALLHKPSILILDEPLSGLDPTSRFQLKNTLKRLADTNVTIIFSSHILEDVEGIATTIGIINQGVLVKIGKPQELQEELVAGDAVVVMGEDLAIYVDKIQKLPIVAKIDYNTETNRMIIRFNPTTELKDGLLELMNFFSSNNIVITNFNHLKPSLEQVYLKYVTEEPNS
ncbi:MAG: ABC transporter ATP-binding protein [Asgard group archaeon]|nr:ABC transporter ATP-binding protein [Asgard group archaeon]